MRKLSTMHTNVADKYAGLGSYGFFIYMDFYYTYLFSYELLF